MPDLDKPCGTCANGEHEACTSSICGCLAEHADDEPMMVGFKRLKRQMHPEREAWVNGGWARPPIRVIAEVGKRRDDRG